MPWILEQRINHAFQYTGQFRCYPSRIKRRISHHAPVDRTMMNLRGGTIIIVVDPTLLLDAVQSLGERFENIEFLFESFESIEQL